MDATRDDVGTTLDMAYRAIAQALTERGYSSTMANGLAQLATDHMQEVMLAAVGR